MATIVTSFSFAVRETQSLGQQMLNAPLGISGLSQVVVMRMYLFKLSLVFRKCVHIKNVESIYFWYKTHFSVDFHHLKKQQHCFRSLSMKQSQADTFLTKTHTDISFTKHWLCLHHLHWRVFLWTWPTYLTATGTTSPLPSTFPCH